MVINHQVMRSCSREGARGAIRTRFSSGLLVFCSKRQFVSWRHFRREQFSHRFFMGEGGWLVRLTELWPHVWARGYHVSGIFPSERTVRIVALSGSVGQHDRGMWRPASRCLR